MRRSQGWSGDPAPETEWQVWYRDTFDLECPPSVDVSGCGLVSGLMELWARYLFETVLPNGGTGFSRFYLWWDGGRAIGIEGSWQGATRLRRWVFGDKKHSQKGYVKEGDTRLLKKIAATHTRLVLADQSDDKILAAAASAADRRDFEARLRNLANGQSF
jgi:hypothetical protein